MPSSLCQFTLIFHLTQPAIDRYAGTVLQPGERYINTVDHGNFPYNRTRGNDSLCLSIHDS